MWKNERKIYSLKLPYPSVLGGCRSNPVPTPEDVQISIQTTNDPSSCLAFWLLSLYHLLSKRQREGLMIRTRIDFQRVQELVDVDVGCWKIQCVHISSERAGFSKHFFTRCVVSNVSPGHPHPSIHTPSQRPPSIYAVCKFPNAQIRKNNCRQKHAYTILRTCFWSHL